MALVHIEKVECWSKRLDIHLVILYKRGDYREFFSFGYSIFPLSIIDGVMADLLLYTKSSAFVVLIIGKQVTSPTFIFFYVIHFNNHNQPRDIDVNLSF